MKLLSLLFSARNRKIRPRSPLIIVFILSAFMLAGASSALALPMPAVEFSSASEYTERSDYTFGYSFKILGDTELWATHLGVYDGGVIGLEESHTVGLWELGGPLVAQTTVPKNGTTVLEGHFRYVEMSAPIKLYSPGWYVVAATWSKNLDPFAYSPTGLTEAAGLKWHKSAYEAGAGLQYPTNYESLVGRFGASLKVSDTDPAIESKTNNPVPEPQTMLLLGLGLIGVAGFGRKRIKKN
jgi:hypothetical protein